MSNYVKSTNFTAKDSLPTGDANKVIRGSEFDTEFNALQVSSATKANLGSPTFTGTATFADVTVTGTADLSAASVTIDINGGTIDNAIIGGTTPAAGTFTSLVATTADINGGTVDGTVIGGSTPAAGTFAAIVGTTGTFSSAVSGTTGTFTGAVSGTTGTFSGAVTGSNLNIANWDTAYGWGNHATAGYLTSVAFSDIDAGAVTTSSETFTISDTQLPTNAAVRDFMIDIYPTIVEINDLSAAVVWTTVPDAYISASSVNQHVTLEKATQTKTYTNGETSAITLSAAITSGAPVVSVTKEVPQTGVTNNDWDAAAASYTLENSAPATTLSFPTFSGNNVTSSFGTPTLEDVSSETTTPTGVFFKPDGLKMYVVSNGTQGDIYQYALSTAFDTTTATLEKTLDINGWGDALSIFFKPDGTRLFIGSTTHVGQFDLTTAWDVSTASAVSAVNVAPYTTATGLYFKPDGSRFYFTGTTSTAYIWEFACNTAWTISGAYYVAGKNLNSLGLANGSPKGLWFASDGSTAYVGQIDNVKQFSLGTAWTLGTILSTPSTSETLTAGLYGLFYTDDFQYLFTANITSNNITRYAFAPASVALGTGSFASTDVGKTINVNDGALVLTATDGSFSITTAPTSYNTAASGSWSMNAVVYDATADVLEVSSVITNTFDVSTASYSQSFSVLTQESQPMGVAFNTAGTKMFVIGRSNDKVYEYTLSTGFDVSTSIYVQDFSVSTQDVTPYALAFNTDGTKMFVVGTQYDKVYEYTLSTGFDISTASYSHSFAVGGQDITPSGIAFNNDGTKMFVVGNSGNDVNEYTLSTGFDVSTASFVDSFSVASQDTNPQGLAFNTDGTKMFVVGAIGDDVNEYTLSTGFDVSTASFVDSFSVATEETLPYGVAFNPDGTKMFIVGDISNKVHEYNIGNTLASTGYQPCISSNIDSTYWTDINSLTATNAVGDGNVFYAVSNDDKTAWSVLDNTGGTRDIMKNNGGTYQYNSNGTYASETWVNATTNTEVAALREAMEGASSLGSAYDVSTASFVDSFSVSPQESEPAGIAFNTDGTKMFITGTSGDDVNEYTLSTGFDVSTASFVDAFSVSGQTSQPRGVVFSSDGTNMYIVADTTGVRFVYQYTLSTGFDVSSASYASKSFNVGSQDTSPHDIALNTDGTKMFVVGQTGNAVYEYAISTAYDVSTASYTQTFSVALQDTSPRGLTFNSDGTGMFVAGASNDSVYQYTLSSAFDLSTASFTQSFSVASQDTAPGGVDFNADGSKMFVLGGNGDDVNEYNVGTTDYTNQMDSTKLNAITDANQITLGNDLDFAAILYFASGSTTPTYSGTAVNYDANVINQGAVLGTDYNWDFPSSTSVRLTSLGAYNLKVRII